MDNAAKGLLMAGGMLIAIITISIFIYGYTNITHMAETKQDEETLKEVNEFNEQYLAFNKNAMYGTDVISALNLAVSNNKLNNVEKNPNDELFVDISFKLRYDSIRDTVYVYRYNTQTDKYDVLKNPNSYSLSEHLEPIKEFLKSSDDKEENKSITKTDEEGTVLEYKVTYRGIADFKRKTFKCSKVEFDSSGRVKKISFEQIKGSSYGEGN